MKKEAQMKAIIEALRSALAGGGRRTMSALEGFQDLSQNVGERILGTRPFRSGPLAGLLNSFDSTLGGGYPFMSQGLTGGAAIAAPAGLTIRGLADLISDHTGFDTKLSADYATGFAEKCAEAGVDPEALVRLMAQED